MRRWKPKRVIPLIAALLALVSGLVVLSQGVSLPDGSRVLPLDDAYIHLQYAWQAAQGHFLEYNTGDVPTTGATSLLYLLILAGGFALGITRTAMPGVMLAGGLGLFMLGAALIADLGRRMARRVGASLPFPNWIPGLLVGLLFAGSGWMAWVYLTGMETGLAVTLILAALWAYIQRRPALTGILLALVALVRPELILLPGLILASELLLRDPTDRGRRRLIGWTLAALVTAAIPLAVNEFASGSTSATGFLSKTMLTYQPFYLDDFIRTAGGTVLDVLVKGFGLAPIDGRWWYVLPLTQLLAVIGGVELWRRGGFVLRRLVLILGAWIVLHVTATATLQTATWHHYRYQAPLFPALALLAGAGLIAVASGLAARWRWARRVERVRLAVRLPLLIAVGWGVYSVATFAASYALDVKTTRDIQIAAGLWLRDNTPPDALIAISDAGAQRFLGERDTLDIVGLTSDGMSEAYRAGPGALYEDLENRRPDYYALYPEVVAPFFGLADAPALFGDVLYTAEAQPWSTIAAAMDRQIVSRPDWSTADLAGLPQQMDVVERLDAEGWTLAATLDAGDLDDETAHDLDWWLEGKMPGFATYVRRMAYRTDPGLVLADGGRVVNGGLSARLALDDGDTLLVARLQNQYPLVLRVTVNEEDVGLWRLPGVPGEWIESTFVIPGDVFAAGRAGDQIALLLDNADPDARLELYHLWAYQGGEPLAPAEPETALRAAFGNVAALTGYDLDERTYAPGDVIPLTLHWEALDPAAASRDLRVFVHVMDPANDSAEGIVAQFDGPPRQGTYPFWVWTAGEQVSDPAFISLPADVPPGEYVLLLGVYDGQTGARLPIEDAADFGADRLSLGTITIE